MEEKGKTIEDLAQILLEMGFDPKMLKGAKLRDVIAAQKLLLEKRKVSLQESAFDLAMKKLMSGENAVSQTVEEAEIIEEKREGMNLEIRNVMYPKLAPTNE